MRRCWDCRRCSSSGGRLGRQIGEKSLAFGLQQLALRPAQAQGLEECNLDGRRLENVAQPHMAAQAQHDRLQEPAEMAQKQTQ